MTATQITADELARLATDIWDWRARQQPALGDDIPRLPRPPGWLPDFSPEAVDRARHRRDGLAARWRALAVGDLAVEAQIDHRLLGSVLSRVTWELDVLQSWLSRSAVPRPPGAQPVLRPAPRAAAVR